MSDLFVVLLPGGVELRGAVLADPLVAVVVVPHALHLRRAVLTDPVALKNRNTIYTFNFNFREKEGPRLRECFWQDLAEVASNSRNKIL